MKRWWAAAVAVMLVLGLTTGCQRVSQTQQVSVPAKPVEPEAKIPTPCESVTLEVLQAMHPVQDNQQRPARLSNLNCQQNRFALAQADIGGASLPVLFEFKDQAWHFVASDYEMPCGTVPAEVWKQWGVGCVPDPVVCRDSQPKVTDIDGVGCPAAIDIAQRYETAIKAGQAQGQGLFWNAAEWACDWPHEDGYSHAGTPLKCTRTTDNKVVRLGEYQR